VTNGLQTFDFSSLIPGSTMTNTTSLIANPQLQDPIRLGINGFSSGFQVQTISTNSTSIRTGSRAPATSSLQIGLIIPPQN
jgi:ethanolamine utilization microcompartment shell protein EutS